MGEVRLRARPRARLRARPATSATATRGSGSSRSWIAPGAARPRRRRGHGPADPQLDLRLAAASARCDRPRRGAASSSIADAGAPRPRRTSPRSATTARSSSTRSSIAALALPELDPDGALLGFAVAELDRNLATDFRPDGVHREASTHYHLIALRSFVGAARERAPLRRRAARTASTSGSRARATSPLHCRRPDGRSRRSRTPTRGDYCATLLELRRRRRSAPRRRRDAPSFPDGGYFVQRSGWDARRRAS